MVAGIYAIVNRETGDRYVGSTGDLLEREQGHLSRLRHNRHPNPHLQAAWNKYGETAFEFVVLEEVAPELLLQAEQGHINQRAEYNILPLAGRSTGYTHTAEGKRKMSAIYYRSRGVVEKPYVEAGSEADKARLLVYSLASKARKLETIGVEQVREAQRRASSAYRARRRARLAVEAAV